MEKKGGGGRGGGARRGKQKSSWASLVAQLVKNPPAMQKTWVRSLGWEDPLEKGKATHSSIPAWRIPWTLQSMGSQRVRRDWANFTFTFFRGVPKVVFIIHFLPSSYKRLNVHTRDLIKLAYSFSKYILYTFILLFNLYPTLVFYSLIVLYVYIWLSKQMINFLRSENVASVILIVSNTNYI